MKMEHYGWGLIRLGLVVCLLSLGCIPEKIQPPKEADAPPATKKDVMQDLLPALSPLREAVRQPAGGALVFTEIQREAAAVAVRDAQIEYGDEDFAREAFDELGREMVSLAKKSALLERWELVEACIDIFELLSLESAPMRVLDDRAKLNLGRPKIRIVGIMRTTETKEAFVIFETVNRRTGEMKLHNLREMESVGDLLVVEIIGSSMAVRFEYLKIPGLHFDVPGPSRK
jgi:hypothetical protein